MDLYNDVLTSLGYNPTENPQDTTLETSWHQNMFLQMSDSLIFEPHDGKFFK
jgi:hypothetical protein